MPHNRTREKFVYMAEKRVVKAIKSIRLVGNLSNKSNYLYTDQDASKIIRALENEVKELKGRFTKGGSKNQIEFNL